MKAYATVLEPSSYHKVEESTFCACRAFPRWVWEGSDRRPAFVAPPSLSKLQADKAPPALNTEALQDEPQALLQSGDLRYQTEQEQQKCPCHLGNKSTGVLVRIHTCTYIREIG